MSNFYLCDICAVLHGYEVCLCDVAVGLADKKAMIDRGYGQGYCDPLEVCRDYVPLGDREKREGTLR